MKTNGAPSDPTSKVIKRTRPLSTVKIPLAGTMDTEESTVVNEEKIENFGNSAFTENDLIKAWEDFAAKRKAEGKD